MVLCGLSYIGSILVYNGSPFVPDPMVTLRFVAKLKYDKYLVVLRKELKLICCELQSLTVWHFCPIPHRSEVDEH